MENIYTKKQETCKLTKASPKTIEFLLNYSKSLEIIDYKGIKFESNKN
ncbi:MAG: hypothetical protein V3U92_20445 [Cellulophaga sp.]